MAGKKNSNQGSDPYYDDYYGQQTNNSAIKESQQKSIMIFLANTDNVVQKSHLLRAMSSKVFTDLKAFDKLGFPLK